MKKKTTKENRLSFKTKRILEIPLLNKTVSPFRCSRKFISKIKKKITKKKQAKKKVKVFFVKKINFF
jgi:hypothetical protein